MATVASMHGRNPAFGRELATLRPGMKFLNRPQGQHKRIAEPAPGQTMAAVFTNPPPFSLSKTPVFSGFFLTSNGVYNTILL